MRSWKRAFSFALATGLFVPAIGSAQVLKNLLYNTVAPCVVADTRAAGGAIAAGATRTWSVVGSGSFAAQGGSASGCGVPGFSGTTAQVQAVELNVIAIGPSGAGDLLAYAADSPTTVSFLNYVSGETVANTGAVTVAQTSGVGDIKVKAEVASTHVLVSVVGYYMKAPQEVLVHPVPGDAVASGTALVNALAGITDAAAAKHYVLKVEAGTYDLGSGTLAMKQYVDVAGSGQLATIIKGTGSSSGLSAATISGAANAELSNLQVQAAVTAGSNNAIGVVLLGVATTLRDVTVAASNTGSGAAEGIRAVNSNCTILGSTVTVSGNSAQTFYGIVLDADSSSAPVIKRTVVSTSGSSTADYGIYLEGFAVPAEIRDDEVQASGGSTAIALYADWANGGGSGNTLGVSTSTFQASSGSANYAIAVSDSGETLNLDQVKATAGSGTSYGLFGATGGNTYVVDRSELTGGTGSVSVGASTFKAGASRLGGAVTAVATCAASYNGSFTALSSACL